MRLKNLLYRFSGCEFLQDEFNDNACSSDDRFPDHHFRVQYDTLLCIFSIPRFVAPASHAGAQPLPIAEVKQGRTL
jgi:hypothetical protein